MVVWYLILGMTTMESASSTMHSRKWLPGISRHPNWRGRRFPSGTPLEKQHAAIAERDESLEASYWGAHIMNGCLPICRRGCTLRVWLVITGPMAGTVWKDERADNLGLYPFLDRDGRAMTFARWMRTWLDDPIQHANALIRSTPPS
jgi:hypothetical protein